MSGDQGTRLLTGVVGAVDAAGVLVSLLGRSVRMRLAGSAVPGDEVVVVQAGRQFVALGGGQAEHSHPQPEPPRWRGSLPNRTIPHNTVTRLSGAPGIYNSDRITVSNGIATVAEAGIYAVSVQGSLSGRVAASRGFVEWAAVTSATRFYRQGLDQEDAFGVTQVFGLNAGDTCYANVYQATGSSLTCSGIQLHLVRLGPL